MIRRIIIVICITGGLFTAVMTAIPFFLFSPMLRPVRFSTTYNPLNFSIDAETLYLLTEDGLKLEAFLVEADTPSAAVIFISGIHNPPVSAFFGHARMLAAEGYSSLLVEMRAHGNSMGDRIALGYEEHLDIRAATELLRGNSRYRSLPIAVFGLSMGGAAAIISAGVIPDIDAVISLSAYSSWEDAVADNMTAMGLPRIVTAAFKPFVKLYLYISFGQKSLTHSPVQQIANLGDRPALLVHSQEDSQVPFNSFLRLESAAPSHIDSWVRDGDLHFIVSGNSFLDPEQDNEYQEVIIEFLKGLHRQQDDNR